MRTFRLAAPDSTSETPISLTAKMAASGVNSSCSSCDLLDKLQVMKVLAPAKINLWLRIFGRRSDGFHEVETLIAPISLYDQIEIQEQSKGVDFQCDNTSIPPGEDNLVVRAAKAFFGATKRKGGVAIKLTKKIPHGAGLGGGSSDAASTLLALNDLFKTKLPREALARIAQTIGSDVPFFLFTSAAVCKGRGEVVTPIKMKDKLSILLLKPDFEVASAWAYSRWQNSRQVPSISYVMQKFGGQTFVNDLERPVFEKFVFLAEVKMWLLKQPEVGAAIMSGSGSTIFAAMKPHADVDLVAKRARQELDRELWTCRCETR